MTRTQKILTVTRDRLADANQERFSDALLLRLLSQQQVLVCSGSNLLKSKAIINLRSGQAEYSMPDDCLGLTRVLGNDKEVLQIISHKDLDSKMHKINVRNETSASNGRDFDRDFSGTYNRSWETDKSINSRYILFDRISPNTLKVYPIPDKIEEVSGILAIPGSRVEDKIDFGEVSVSLNSDFGEISNSPGDIVDSFGFTSDVYWHTTGIVDPNIYRAEIAIFGLVVDFSNTEYLGQTLSTTVEYINDPIFGTSIEVEGYTTDLYGFVSDILDDTKVDLDSFDNVGIMTDWSTETLKQLTVYYEAKPEEITDVAQKLSFEEVFDIPLTYFIASEALLVNQDTESVSRANNFMRLGERSILELGKTSYQNLSNHGSMEVPYNTGFEH